MHDHADADQFTTINDVVIQGDVSVAIKATTDAEGL